VLVATLHLLWHLVTGLRLRVRLWQGWLLRRVLLLWLLTLWLMRLLT
jgi:hypothetical protein